MYSLLVSTAYLIWRFLSDMELHAFCLTQNTQSIQGGPDWGHFGREDISAAKVCGKYTDTHPVVNVPTPPSAHST